MKQVPPPQATPRDAIAEAICCPHRFWLGPLQLSPGGPCPLFLPPPPHCSRCLCPSLSCRRPSLAPPPSSLPCFHGTAAATTSHRCVLKCTPPPPCLCTCCSPCVEHPLAFSASPTNSLRCRSKFLSFWRHSDLLAEVRGTLTPTAPW